MSRHPELKWAQRLDKVYITVLLADSTNAKVNLEPEGIFTFSATAGADKKLFELKLDLHDKVNVEESKINIGARSIVCVIEKAESGWWNKLLRGAEKTPHYVKIDWDKWVDEDDDGGAAAAPSDLDMGGMDFSKFANMEGMGGMGGMMGGMGGMGGMMGGMGGMGGMMGGMGGMEGMMGGMGGMEGMMGGMGDDAMGDDFDESDDEGQEVEKPGVAEEVKQGESKEVKTEATPST